MHDDYEDDTERFDAYETAKRVMSDHLITTFQSTDFLKIMDNDPECIQLLDSDFDAVFDAMNNLRSVYVRVE